MTPTTKSAESADDVDDASPSIAWEPGMCATPDCGRLVPEGSTPFCGPCDILFGSYHDLLKAADVTEWQAEVEVNADPVDTEIGPEPEPATEEPAAPTTKKARSRGRRKPPPVPRLEVESDTS